MPVLRKIGAERRERQILEDEPANQPRGDLQRQDREPEERHDGCGPRVGRWRDAWIERIRAGGDDAEAGAVSFRFRDGSQDNGIPVDEAVERIVAAVRDRT